MYKTAFFGILMMVAIGCVQSPHSVADIMNEDYLNQEVTVSGTASYSPVWCTEMYCYFASIVEECGRYIQDDYVDERYYSCLDETECEPGERRECNSCGASVMLDGIELRNSEDEEFKCDGKEVLVCGAETEYEFSECEFKNGTEYEVTGILRTRENKYTGKTDYYLEVKEFKEISPQ